jgi:hypothetical protein
MLLAPESFNLPSQDSEPGIHILGTAENQK